MTTLCRLACFLLVIQTGITPMTTHAADQSPRQPLTQAFADAFARDWVDGWNSHDIERILAHYSADFEMRSPLIAQRGFSATGRLVGKEAVRAYWTPAVGPGSTLRFELLQVRGAARRAAFSCVRVEASTAAAAQVAARAWEPGQGPAA